jgi:membrane-associated HD superfamily phosphohydrolase
MNFEPSERTLRVHTNKGRRDDTKQEQFPTKKIKVRHELGEETFFMDDENKNKIEDDFMGESFFMDDNKLQTPSAQKRDIQELHSDIEEDEVQEVELSSVKKNSASTSKSPHRLASPMKPSDKQTPTQPMGGSELPPPWFGVFLKTYTESMKDMKETVVDSVRDLVKEEIEKARLKPEQDKKDEEIEEVEEDK